jgi:hypothetical protein
MPTAVCYQCRKPIESVTASWDAKLRQTEVEVSCHGETDRQIFWDNVGEGPYERWGGFAPFFAPPVKPVVLTYSEAMKRQREAEANPPTLESTLAGIDALVA